MKTILHHIQQPKFSGDQLMQIAEIPKESGTSFQNYASNVYTGKMK